MNNDLKNYLDIMGDPLTEAKGQVVFLVMIDSDGLIHSDDPYNTDSGSAIPDAIYSNKNSLKYGIRTLVRQHLINWGVIDENTGLMKHEGDTMEDVWEAAKQYTQYIRIIQMTIDSNSYQDYKILDIDATKFLKKKTLF